MLFLFSTLVYGTSIPKFIISLIPTSYNSSSLSRPDLTGRLVGISLLKLYSNEVTGLGPEPLRRGGAIASTHRHTGEAGNGNQSTRLEYKAHPSTN
jgi:hypothetical protein